jgi:post-segregation antitoxin (ccd killing protein)
MASNRTTFTLEDELAEQARSLKINVSAAAREGVAAAVREALLKADRAAYLANPESSTDDWQSAEAWGDA